MNHDPDIQNRRSIRLKGYDYKQPGAYFVTVCTQQRECLFGNIADGKMVLNNAGMMIQTVWDEIPPHYSGIETDEFVVMPNHIHGIIVIVGAGPRACPDQMKYKTGQPRGGAGTGQPQGVVETGQPQGVAETGQPRGVAPTVGLSLPDVVHRFKTMTTKRYTDGVKHHGWSLFPGKLWQRNYWEHIVRNEPELIRFGNTSTITRYNGNWTN